MTPMRKKIHWKNLEKVARLRPSVGSFTHLSERVPIRPAAGLLQIRFVMILVIRGYVLMLITGCPDGGTWLCRIERG